MMSKRFLRFETAKIPERCPKCQREKWFKKDRFKIYCIHTDCGYVYAEIACKVSLAKCFACPTLKIKETYDLTPILDMLLDLEYPPKRFPSRFYCKATGMPIWNNIIFEEAQ